MRQKLYILLILILVLTTCAMNVFADDLLIEERILSDREIASAIEMLSPKVGTDGDVLINDDSLYINIRLNQPVKVYYSLYKVDPNIFGAEEKTVEPTEQSTHMVDDLVTTLDVVEQDSETEIVVEEEIPEILSEMDKERFRSRIISDYIEYETKLEVSIELLNDYKILVIEEFGEIPVVDDSTILTSNQTQMLTKLNELAYSVKEARKTFVEMESRYNQLFEKLVLEQEEVKVSEVLPYYKTEIEDIDSGEYKMVFFSDDETQKAIKVFYFTIKTSEETLEKIVDAIPQDLNQIWLIEPSDKSIGN